MSEEENIGQLTSEAETQTTADARKAAKDIADVLTWSYRTAMTDLNYAVVLAHCPVYNLEDFTIDNNLPHDPHAAQFTEKFRGNLARAVLMLKDCDGELPRA